MYRRTDAAIAEAETAYMPSMDAFIRDFAPAPPPRQDSQWLDFFLDIATTGAAAGLGKLFKAGKTLQPERIYCLFTLTKAF